MPISGKLRKSLMTLAVVGAVLAAIGARAENQALILWIGDYAEPAARLPGIDIDAKRARQIALAMNVPAANIVEKKNQQLTLAGLGDAIAQFTDRIHPGDKVFVYYSGHGAQRKNAAAGKPCSEGLVAQDLRLFLDSQLESDLSRLGAKASQVVMMNDSCFSGGAAQKGLPGPGRTLVAKGWSGALAKSDPAASAAYTCGEAVNKGVLAKTFEVVQRQGANVLYIAAAQDDEVSYASSEGSLATEAWAACVADPATDSDHSGSISGEELRACAQHRIAGNAEHVQQHITLVGTPALPVSFAAPDPQAPAAVLSAANALRDLSVGADKSYTVRLTPAKTTVHIGQDFLEFDVATNLAGYLYIFQVGSDGKTFNLLFPNKIDADNKVPAGVLRLPRAAWALRSNGPAGTSSLMALVSSTPRDFSAQMSAAGPFATAPATHGGAKSLMVVATGAGVGGNGRYGTSAVVAVTEVP